MQGKGKAGHVLLSVLPQNKGCQRERTEAPCTRLVKGKEDVTDERFVCWEEEKDTRCASRILPLEARERGTTARRKRLYDGTPVTGLVGEPECEG